MANFKSFKNKLLIRLNKLAGDTKDFADKAADKTKDFAEVAADKTKDFAEKAADKTKDLAEKAADKAKATARIAKLNMEISAEKDNMKKTYLEIGKLYYDTHKENPEGFFIQLCEEIALAEKNIADKQAEIAELKTKDEDDSIEVEIEEYPEEETVEEDPGEDIVVEIVEEAAEEVSEETAEETTEE